MQKTAFAFTNVQSTAPVAGTARPENIARHEANIEFRNIWWFERESYFDRGWVVSRSRDAGTLLGLIEGALAHLRPLAHRPIFAEPRSNAPCDYAVNGLVIALGAHPDRDSGRASQVYLTKRLASGVVIGAPEAKGGASHV